MAATDRLSALDGAFLDLDHPDAPLHVGLTMRLDGPPPSLAGLRAHIAGRLDRIPAFRRRVLTAPTGLGDAVWADDPGFDIARHVHAVTVAPAAKSNEPSRAKHSEPSPGDDGLAELAGTLLSTPLARGRPLWCMYLVRGLPDGGWALIAQVHHVLLDGVAGMQVAGLLLDLEPEPASADTVPSWRPKPAPGLVAATAATARDRALAGARTAGALAAQAASLGGLAREAAGGLAAAAALRRSTPATPLDATHGPERVVAFADVELDVLRAAGRAGEGRLRATVNDVLLSAVTLALGEALERRGTAAETVRALVPVDVRAAGDRGLGNQISFVACDLPTSVREPAAVLRRVHRQMAERKRAGEARPLAALARAADALPSAGRRTLTRAVAGQVSFTTIVSNVPGPPVPLYLMGRRLRSLAPAVPLLHGRALTVGAVSYTGTLHLGLYADAGVVDDLPAIAASLDRAFTALASAPATGPTPWRQRARARRAG